MTLPPPLRQAARRLARDWSFTTAAAITLGVAIAANTVIFGAVHAVLLRPLPMANADRLYVLWNGNVRQPGVTAVAAPEFLDYRERLTAFEGLAAVRDRAVNLLDAGEPLRLNALRVSPNLGRVLGIAPVIGRDFDARDAGGAARAVLLSHHVWQQVFGADANLVGRTIRLDDRPHTVVGVLPASLTFPDAATFHMPRQSDVWIAEAWEELRGDSRGNQILRVVGAARPGATPASIAQDLDRVAARFRSEYPARYSEASGWRPVAVPFRDELVGSTRPALTLLMGAAALVLVIACANVANLLLGRGAARRKEFGVKAALGASPFRLARDFTWEAALLGGLAGAMAVSLSAIALPALAAAAPESVPLVAGARLDVVTIAFAAGLSIVVVLLVGLAPALRVSAGDLQPALRDSAAGEGWFWRSVRTGLIVGEIGLAFLVLSLAGVLFRSGVRMAQADLGFRPAGVVTMKVSLPAERYPEAPHRAAFFGDLLGRLASHPQVQGAALADPIPLGGEQWSATLRVEGRDPAPGAALPHAEFYRVSHGYFRAIQGRILEGRDFSAADDRRAPYVVIVDEAFARQHFPGRSAVGQRVNPRGPDAPWSTIVGVVARVRRDGPRHAGEGQLYLPYAQSPTPRMDLIVRSSADTAGVAAIVRGAVRQIDSTMPVTKLSRLEDLAASVTAGDRFTRLLTTAFAGCALLLAAVGLYGVVAYLVTARTREIGIRLALGSTPAAIRRGVLREGSGWAALGIAGGTCAAFAVSGAVSALVFEVSPLDARTLAAAAVATLAISLAASYIPARRAAAMDPLQALRE